MNWGRHGTDRRLIMDYVFFIENRMISRNYKWQLIIIRSIIDVEYIVASYSTIEAIWLRKVLDDIKLLQLETILIKCDNQGCLYFIKNLKYHLRIKYVIQFYFIQKKIEIGMIDIKCCATKNILSNLLTKLLIKVFEE